MAKIQNTHMCFGPTHVSLSLRSVCYDLMDITKYLLFI